jgi:outer membrane protein, heavy metal efflux system
MKTFFYFYSGLIVASCLHQLRADTTLDSQFLFSLRSEAVKNHPATVAAKLRAHAAARDVRGVRLWDDPSIGLSLMAADNAKRRDDGDVRLSYDQPLPKPGLFQANLTKADALNRAEFEKSVSTSYEIGAAAAKDAIELALADESVFLQSAQIQWLQTMAENARQMALNPGATSIDALRLESELAKESQILAAARRSRASLAQRLNLRLGRTLDSAWPILKLPSNPSPAPIAASEIARIPKANPKLRSMREMAAAAGADVRIADRERQPQFSIGVDANFYARRDFRSTSIGLKMSLPYFNRSSYDAKTQSSQLREKAAIKDIESTRLEIAAAVVAAVAEAANNAAQARAYAGEIYQRSLQATQAVEGAWISSKSSLTDLLDANRALFSIRLEQRRFVAMQQVALEELNLLVPNHR